MHGVHMCPSVPLWVSVSPYGSLCVPICPNVPPMSFLCLYVVFIGSLMGISGPKCLPMGIYGFQCGSYVSVWVSLSPTVIHGVPMCPNVHLLVPVSPYGSLYVSICPNVTPVGCYVPLWVLYGVSYGYLWARISSYWSLCVSKLSYVSLLVLMAPNVSL